MSTSQTAVMLYGWEVKAGMACLQVKLCVAIYLSALENALVFKGALQMSRFTSTFTSFSLCYDTIASKNTFCKY